VLYMGRKRTLHKREKENIVQGVSSLPPTNRLREEVYEILNKEKLDAIEQKKATSLIKQLKKATKELGMSKEDRRLRTEYARLILQLKTKLGMVKRSGGATPVLLKIFKGNEEELREWLITKIQNLRRKYKADYGTDIPYSQLLKKLREHLIELANKRNIRLKKKVPNELALSERTIRNYIDKNGLLEVQSKATTVNLFKSILWEEFEKKKKNAKYYPHIRRTVKAFWNYLKNTKGEDYANSPMEWTTDDVKEFIYWLYEKRGLKTNTLRSYVVHLRRFWDEGLKRRDLADLKLKDFKFKGVQVTELKTPDRILYFTPETLDRMVQLVPHKSYTIQYESDRITKSGKRSVIKRTLKIESEADRQMYQALIRFLANSGARTGDFANPKQIGERIEAILKTWHVPETIEELSGDVIFNLNHGAVSVRLQDLEYTHITKQQLLKMAKDLELTNPFEAQRLRNMAENMKQDAISYWSVKGIKEKMGIIWTNIMLSEKTSKELEEYLRARFNLDKSYTGEKLERFIINYVKNVRSEIDAIAGRWLELYHIAQEKPTDEQQKIYRQIGKEFLEYYKKTLLFPIQPNDIHTLIYVLAQRGIETNQPIYLSVTKGKPIKLDIPTVKRMEHKGHLFRKSFVQNLLNKGTPMEVVSEFNVGWEDLTTLKKFYGHLPMSRRILTYLTAVRYTI